MKHEEPLFAWPVWCSAGFGLPLEYAGPHAEPDLLAALVGMAENHRSDRLADRRVLVRGHPPAVEELRNLNQPGSHWVAEIDEDAEGAVGGDPPAEADW